MFKDMIEELVNGADVVVKTIPVYNHEVKVTLARKGQDVPASSDRVVVRFTIAIPAKNEGKTIEPALIFGMRVNIMGEWLYGDWGMANKLNTHRLLYDHGYGYTWREAAELAVATHTESITNLLDQIAMRKKALEDADAKP